MKFQSNTVNPKFTPARTEAKPAPPKLPFLETSFKTSVSALLEHGYTFEQIQRMTGNEFVEIYETLRLSALSPARVSQVENPFAK